MINQTTSGLWAANDTMEATARQVIGRAVADFSNCATDIYEAGVQVPTLPARHGETKELRIAGLFLKRTLVDLRATWRLVLEGYTAPAASVAASLAEHALTVEVVASDSKHTTELEGSANGDIPWSPRQLTQLAAKAATVRDGDPEKIAAERARNIYAAYKWLCKIKHPTLRASVHVAQSTGTKDGAFVIMAAPDLQEADLPAKRMVLTITLGRTVQAIRAFAKASETDQAAENTVEFNRRLDRGEQTLLSIVRKDADSKLPFGLTKAEGARL